MLYAVLITSIAFAVFLLAHVLIFHARPVRKRFRALVYIACGSLLLYCALFAAGIKAGWPEALHDIVPDRTVGLLGGLFFYFWCWYFYGHLIIVFDRSVSTRMMVDIVESREKRMTADEIRKSYSLEEKFRYELKDMHVLKRIEPDGRFYRNMPKGIRHGRTIDFLRRFLNIGGHQ